MLADDFPKRIPAIGRPAQDELLRPLDFLFFKDKRYLFQLLRLVENQPNRLGSRFCGAPPPQLSRNEGRLDRIAFLLRGDLNNGRPFDIQPAFCGIEQSPELGL